MTDHTQHMDETDYAILAELRELYRRLDPVPAGLGEDVRFALSVQWLEAEVAEIVESTQLVVRGPGTSTPMESVTFTAGSLSLMISTSLSADGAEVRVDGWVTRGGARVDAIRDTQVVSVRADENGRFVIAAIPRGRMYFVIHPDEDESTTPVVTPAVEV